MSLQERNIRAGVVSLRRQGILKLAGATAPTASTGVGSCGKGSEYTDTATGKLYTNIGTKAVPSWQVVGAQT